MMTAAKQERNSALPAEREAGICLHLTSLPGAYGIGEIGSAARAFVDFLSSARLNLWQFLPTGPTAFGDSPYQPLSCFAGNEMLIDVGDLLELGLLLPDESAALRSLPDSTVDYGKLIPVKHALLARAASRFASMVPSSLRQEFDEFLERSDKAWLHDYAVFRLLKTQHGERPWPDWAGDYVHRNSTAVRRLEQNTAAEIEAIKVIQFLFDHQWRALHRYAAERRVHLFGDMPICIALDSADAWANRDMLQIDRQGRPVSVAGVPPDFFSKDGQLWGNPLYDWKFHEANGYAWWIERLRHAAALADLVRIDHFRGFESYWSVPANESTARNGRWEPGPGDAIFEAMHRELGGDLPIVAEDLGVITPAVESLRDRHGIPGMKVLQFDVSDEQFEIDDIDENCVCYTGTHDNDTTVGWFHGSVDDMRSVADIRRTRERVLRLTGGTAGTVHKDLIRLAFESDARYAIAPMQDYLGLGSESRLNTPGTSCNNWRWRLQNGALGPALRDEIGTLVDAVNRGS